MVEDMVVRRTYIQMAQLPLFGDKLDPRVEEIGLQALCSVIRWNALHTQWQAWSADPDGFNPAFVWSALCDMDTQIGHGGFFTYPLSYRVGPVVAGLMACRERVWDGQYSRKARIVFEDMVGVVNQSLVEGTYRPDGEYLPQ